MKIAKRVKIPRYRTQAELDDLRSRVDQQSNEIKCDLLTLNEQTLLLSFYQKEVVDYFLHSTKVSFPTSVYSSACHFTRMFYLKTSIYKIDPRFLCYLCFYVAAKVEHNYMSISSYLKMLPERYRSYREDFVLKEGEVMKNMNFDLSHSSVFAAVDGLLLQYEFYINNKATAEEKSRSHYFTNDDSLSKEDKNDIPIGDISKNQFIMKLRHKARTQAFFLITTDLILIYPPSQLAPALLIDDVGLDVLHNMLICFMETNQDADYVEKYAKRYSGKVVEAKKAIVTTVKSHSANWKELVRKYNKIVSEISKQ